MYTAGVDDAHGCSVDTLLTLSNIDLPPLPDIEQRYYHQHRERMQMVAINAPDYVWTPATGVSCANCATPVVGPRTTAAISLMLLTNQNCVAADTVTIYLFRMTDPCLCLPPFRLMMTVTMTCSA